MAWDSGEDARFRTDEIIPAVNVADPNAPSAISYSRLKKYVIHDIWARPDPIKLKIKASDSCHMNVKEEGVNMRFLCAASASTEAAVSGVGVSCSALLTVQSIKYRAQI